MNGYVYNPDNRKIAVKIPNVTKCNDTAIKGDGFARLGTGQYIITDQNFNEGDTLPIIEDKRNTIPLLIE